MLIVIMFIRVRRKVVCASKISAVNFRDLYRVRNFLETESIDNAS